jgi:hypothetical protein
MATDEEIREEAEKQYGAWIRCDDITSMKLLERLIKKGIQMERQRLRKQVKEKVGTIEAHNPDELIGIIEIDIWDDVK